MSEATTPLSWDMWAGQRTTGGTDEMVFCHVGNDPRHPKMHGVSEPIAVTVTESPVGRYWGWLPARSRVTGELIVNGEPKMIFERETLFSVCFPYGHENEEKAGNGRVLRLDITLRP